MASQDRAVDRQDRGTADIMREAGVAKTVVWRWQERFMQEGVDGLLRDKTRPSASRGSRWRSPNAGCRSQSSRRTRQLTGLRQRWPGRLVLASVGASSTYPSNGSVTR